jgi:hypothetical protein
MPDGSFVEGISNPDYAVLFAAIVTEFNAVETRMPNILSVLLGMPDSRSAGYVYRAIINAGARLQVMKAVLEKAPNNAERGDEYDDVLKEFGAIRLRRNNYVHGLWYTQEKTNKVFLSVKDEHGFAFFDAKEEPIKNLQELLDRIRKLNLAILKLCTEERKKSVGSKDP